MKDNILNLIKSSKKKMSIEDIEKIVHIDQLELKTILKELQLDGLIIRENNKYKIFPDDNYIGVIYLTSSGNKTIKYEGVKYPVLANYQDYLIINDTVSFKITDDGKADITSIIDRKIKTMTCKVIKKDNKVKIECFYKGLSVSLPKEITNNLRNGDVISVSIDVNDIDSGYCNATFKDIVGHADDPNLDELIIATNYGYTSDYGQEYYEELANIKTEVTKEDLKDRIDLRDIPFVTIDCMNSKDLDDAVYAEKIDDENYRLYVSIADVSHYVKLNSEIFRRAYENGNSWYINNCVFHMLHEILSNGICSLNPNADRLTKTVIMNVNKYGVVTDYKICKSVIRSRKKMDYDSIDEIVEKENVPNGYKEHLKGIYTLYKVSKLLEDNAINNYGKINFPSNELIKEYDESGAIISVRLTEDSSAKKMIEYPMIAANVCVASFLSSSYMTSIYRVHGVPNIRKVNDILKYINDNKDIDAHFHLLNSAAHPQSIQAILKKLSRLEEYPILANFLLQSMERAVYQTENTGHYALGVQFYTHFTSPIRRLCDLLVHTVLDISLGCYEDLENFDFEEFDTLLNDAAKQASIMERQAEAAEIEGTKLAILKSMEKSVGEYYEGTIIDIGERLRIKVNGIDTFIKYKDLSDNFIFDEKTCRYYDKNNGCILKLGAKISVQLLGVNLNNRSLSVKVDNIIKSRNKILKKSNIN